MATTTKKKTTKMTAYEASVRAGGSSEILKFEAANLLDGFERAEAEATAWLLGQPWNLATEVQVSLSYEKAAGEYARLLKEEPVHVPVTPERIAAAGEVSTTEPRRTLTEQVDERIWEAKMAILPIVQGLADELPHACRAQIAEELDTFIRELLGLFG